MTDKTKSRLRDALVLLAGSITVFLLAHIYYLTKNTFMMYLELYAEKIWSFLFPLLAVRFALSELAAHGARSAVLSAVISVLTRTVFLFPFYYEYYVLDEGFVTSDALLLSLLRTLIMLLASAIHVALYLLLALLTARVIRARRGDGAPLGEYLSLGSSVPSLFDFVSPAVSVSALLAAVELVYSLILEIIDTAEFLTASIVTLEPLELFTMVFNYVLLIGLFFAGHYLTVRAGAKGGFNGNTEKSI
ncbi:MAG: hypothetical protein IJW48_03470 [Clostridia bacterium]|nr:hypothetical protein [Clostridia bacterium]